MGKVICLCPQGAAGEQGKFGVILLQRKHMLHDVVFDYRSFQPNLTDELKQRLLMLIERHQAQHVYIMLSGGLSEPSIAVAKQLAVTLSGLESVKAAIHLVNPQGEDVVLDQS